MTPSLGQPTLYISYQPNINFPSFHPDKIQEVWQAHEPTVSLCGLNRSCNHCHPSLDGDPRLWGLEARAGLKKCIDHLGQILSQFNPDSALFHELSKIREQDVHFFRKLQFQPMPLFGNLPSPSNPTDVELTPSGNSMIKLAQFLDSRLDPTAVKAADPATTKEPAHAAGKVLINKIPILFSQQSHKRKRVNVSQLELISKKAIDKGSKCVWRWRQLIVIECFSRNLSPNVKVEKDKQQIVICYPHARYQETMPTERGLIERYAQKTEESIKLLTIAMNDYPEFEELFVELRENIQCQNLRAKKNLRARDRRKEKYMSEVLKSKAPRQAKRKGPATVPKAPEKMSISSLLN